MAMIVSSMVTTTPRSTYGANRFCRIVLMSTLGLCQSDQSMANATKRMITALIQRPQWRMGMASILGGRSTPGASLAYRCHGASLRTFVPAALTAAYLPWLICAEVTASVLSPYLLRMLA